MPTLRPSAKPPAPVQATAATAILVLGMHRSGTSAIARLLNLRGAELGRDLLPAKQDNERGFWENCAILEAHETLLAQQGLQWYDLVAPAPDWQRSAPARRFVADLPGVLDRQFADAQLLLVKDPRLSSLAPLWLEVLRARHVRPVFVVTVRHPNEVAASLARRDGLPVAQAQLLWLQHLIEAERATRGQTRVVVHYEHLLDNWQRELDRIGEQLAIDWPPAPAGFAAAVAQFLAPTLRHHHAGREIEAQMPPIIADAYRQACAAASGPAPAALLENVGVQFDALAQAVAPLYRALADRQAVTNEQHAREIEQARSNIDALTAELGAAREAHARRDQLESDQRAALAERDAQIERAREALALKDAEIDAARQGVDALRAELDAARVNIDTLTTELGLSRENIHALAAEIAAARVNIEAQAADLELARQAHATKDEEIGALRRSLSSREHEIDAARSNIDAMARDIERARDGFAAKDAEIDAARRNIDNLVAEIERARRAHGARDAADAALRHARWYRLGRSLRLIAPHSNDDKSS